MKCKRCKGRIGKNEKFVLLRTSDKGKSIEDIYFHFKCYIDWRDESITNRAKKIYASTMNKVLGGLGININNPFIDNEKKKTDEGKIREIWVG